jgi:hypothetical protein
MAMLLYSVDHQGRLPASLHDLVNPYLHDENSIRCPELPDNPTDEYLAPNCILRQLGANEIIAYDHLGNTLFGDGHITWYEPGVLQKMEQGWVDPDGVFMHGKLFIPPVTRPSF